MSLSQWEIDQGNNWYKDFKTFMINIKLIGNWNGNLIWR